MKNHHSIVARPSIVALCAAAGAAGLLLFWNASAQTPASKPAEPAAQSSDAEVRAKLDKLMDEQGIKIDRARKLLSVRGRFCAPKQPLEYLVTAPHGSHYESLVAIDAKPSNIAAALLSLGVDAGKGPERKPKIPKPTEEEIKAGALMFEMEPGSGDHVYLYVEWNDARGFHRNRIEDLVFERPQGETVGNLGFIFVNSQMVPPRNKKEVPAYAADLDGNLASLSAGGSPVLVFEKPHPYATEGDFEIYQPNWTLVPSDPMPVVLIFTTQPLDKPLVPEMAPPESKPSKK